MFNKSSELRGICGNNEATEGGWEENIEMGGRSIVGMEGCRNYQ
jgi:hypothetical protein